MTRTLFAAAAATGLLLPLAAPAAANPGDEWRKQFEIRADCDKKLAEADSRRKFNEELRVCRKKMAEWRGKVREEAMKEWAEREKKARERWR